MADTKSEKAATGETVYRIASISKMITAAAVMRLVERRDVGLDASIRDYIKSYPDKQWPIAIHHLLSHQSGIRHWIKREKRKNTRRYSDLDSSLDSFKNEPLLFEPGARDEYSTPGYNVLGAVIEGVSGRPYDVALEKLVLRQTGTTSLRPDHLQPESIARAGRYRAGRDGAVPAPPHDVSIKMPGGGLSGSAQDLAVFAPRSSPASWSVRSRSSSCGARRFRPTGPRRTKARDAIWAMRKGDLSCGTSEVSSAPAASSTSIPKRNTLSSSSQTDARPLSSNSPAKSWTKSSRMQDS